MSDLLPSDSDSARRSGWGFLALMLLSLLGIACDRPFVEVSVPTIEVVEPDPSLVQESAALTFTVRASSFRQVSRVEIGGRMLDSSGDGEWTTRIELAPGLNRIVVEAFDQEEVAGVDTVHYLHLQPVVQVSARRWETPRAGHSATVLPFGDIVLAGGAGTTITPAQPHIFVLPFGETEITTSDTQLRFARFAHSASLLPDGRILFAGGTDTPLLSETQQLVETPEIYNPSTGTITSLTVTGEPIRRAFHTASVRNSNSGLILDLLGGTGDVTYRPQSELGIRRDIRSFLLEGDTLHALSPAIGPFIEFLTGHSQTDLARQPVGTPTRQLISGAIFLEPAEAHHFVLDPRSALGFMFEDLAPPPILRAEHAAVQAAPGRVLRFGGITGPADPPSTTADLYEDAIAGFLRFDPEGAMSLNARSLQTATFTGNDRILIVGGFDDRGVAIETIEIVSLGL